jgi:hypothetical protein
MPFCCSSGGKAGKGEDQPCEHPRRFWSSTQIILGELTTQPWFNHLFVQVENLKEFECKNYILICFDF